MCGRFVSPEEAAIERAVTIGRKRRILWKPSFNVAPSMAVPVLLACDGTSFQLDTARWGFVPHWWKQPTAPKATINARIETVADKPMWRDAFRRRRCLIPALGWYEWARQEIVDGETGEVRAIKQPHYLSGPAGRLLLFAGLYSERPEERPDERSFQNADEPTETHLTVAILTQPAQGAPSTVHDRMPVILDPDVGRGWVDPEQRDRQTLQALLQRSRFEAIATHPVSRRVNRPGADDPALIEPIPARGA